ncbi:MAG: preprotein translocase subunit YajC [Bacillota bacterium]|nr:preprotein translocase subunit YajC [Bacillota bacterium]
MPTSCLGTGTTTGTAAATTGGTDWMMLLMPILLLVVILFVMIIPQRRREKKVKAMLNAMKAGDRIRTIGGLYGKIYSIKDDIVMIEVGPERIKMEFAKTAISTVESAEVVNDAKLDVKPEKTEGKSKGKDK